MIKRADENSEELLASRKRVLWISRARIYVLHSLVPRNQQLTIQVISLVYFLIFNIESRVKFTATLTIKQLWMLYSVTDLKLETVFAQAAKLQPRGI